MNRRDALFTTGSMVLSASLGALACGGGTAVAQNTPKAPPSPAPPTGGHAHAHGGDAGLAHAAHHCMAAGEACISHCIGMLSSGDTSMAGCMKAVHDMKAVMEGLAAAASSGSKHLPALAKVAAEFCKDCEAECRKHEGMHAVCKDCAEACAKTVAACNKAAG
jgi:Cys-rich four helix bundle protein (predicted Tat secretion target)